jgi:enoyl-CoA hydratase/carnithine racemase
MQDSKPGDDNLLWEVKGAIGVITLNRPAAHNALTFDMYDRLGQICATAAADGRLRAIIITGAGGRAFGAGTDISLFRDFKPGPADGIAYEERMERMFAQVEACPVPLIAAIPGICTGGAAAIAATCDLRIATRNFKFGFPIARTRLPTASRPPTSPASPC